VRGARRRRLAAAAPTPTSVPVLTTPLPPSSPPSPAQMCGATTTLLYGANLVLDPVSEDATPDPESDVKGMVKVAAPYHVRVMVPTYSEPLDIVAKTCAAAATAWLPRGCRVTVYLCDDGKDRKKRNWCFKGDGRAHGVVYVSGRTRASGEMNGKSANLNNCMRHLYPDGKPVPPNEIVAVFDADQVANPDFFLKTLYKLDAGDDVAMVLSPQAFYNTRLNADIFNHSNIHFWEYAQHGYDALGFISCTGTNFLCRAAAYKDAGWSPEYTLTEDFALGMELKKKKWECRCVGRASERGRARGWRPRARSDTRRPPPHPLPFLSATWKSTWSWARPPSRCATVSSSGPAGARATFKSCLARATRSSKRSSPGPCASCTAPASGPTLSGR